MQEKQAVSDTLSTIKTLVNALTYATSQCNNEALRSTYCAYRNQLETLQFEIYQVAKQHGYYVPAAPAGQADIEAVKTAISG